MAAGFFNVQAIAHPRKLPLALMLLAFSALAAEHRGQVKFGGLPVPGVSVTVIRGDQTLTAVTDPQGAYNFPDLTEGTWKFHIEMLGFAPIDRDVLVAPGTPAAAWDLEMLPTGAMNAVAVSAPATGASPAAKTAGATETIGTTPATAPSRSRLRSRAQATPTNTQTPFQRAEVNATAAAPPPDPTASQNSGDLQQRASDGFLINGTTNNAATSPFSISPAFGNNRRGQRSLYNGNLGFTFDNSALDARPFSLTGQDTPRPAYSNFTGLASFGGPLRIPHLVRNGPNVFVNYQWTRNRNASTASALMPTLAERSGDFSHVLTPQGKPVTVIDPSTGQPFFGNMIPANRFSPQAAALLQLYPLPNFAGSGYNYQAPLAGITHQDSLQWRVNQVFNPANQIFGAFAMQSTRSDTPNVFQFLDRGSMLGLNTSVNWRHRFTPRFFGTFGFQFNRQSLRTTPFFSNRENIAGAAGITGNNQDPINWGPPNLNFASGIQALSDATPSFTRNQTSAVSFGGLWNRGRHNLQFGADFRRQEFNLTSQQDPRGTFGFTGNAAGYDFAGFLLGIPDTSSIAFGNADKYFRVSNYDAYLTDDWRIAPNLTVNVGARWEYWSPITELYGRLVNLDIAPGYTAVTPVLATDPTGALTGRHYPDSLMNPDKRAIQPRVGFSWRPLPASSLLVRGGYGVYYNTSVYFPIASQMAQQSPFSKSLSVSNSATNPLTLASGFLASPDITTNTFAVDPNLRIGYAQIWTASLQRDLPRSLVLIVSYTGIKGTRGLQEFLPNTYPAGAVNPCPTCPSGFIYLTSNGNSTRESGQVQLRRRLRAGFTAELDYTFAKSIDDSSLGGRNAPVTPAPTGGGAGPAGNTAGAGNGASAGGSAPVIAQNWLNLSAERGLSNFDQRHLASLVLQYTTGMGLGGGTLVGGWKGALFKEWTFLSNVSAGTGLPLTPVYVTPVRGTGITGSVRPEYTGAPLYAAPAGYYLNRDAYIAPLPGEWGNAGRNSITGPPQFTWNASLGRTFRMNDRLNLDVRFDSTNALNHVTFSSWNTTATSTQFGLPSATNAMRSVLTTVRLRF